MRSRLTAASLRPGEPSPALSPTVVPGVGGVVVVETRPLSVAITFRESRGGPDLATVEVSLPQWALLVEDVDVAILAARLGLLCSPAGVQ